MTEIETWSSEITAKISDRGKDEQLFVFTTFAPSDGQGIEKGFLSIRVTDGVHFWRSKEKLAAEDLSKSSGRGRILSTLEALTEKFPSTQPYTYRMETKDGDLFFDIMFSLKGGVSGRLRVQLFPVDNAKAEVASTLDTLIANLKRLEVARNELLAAKYVLESEAASISTLKQEFAPNKEARDLAERGTYQGATALINRKKKQLRAAAGQEKEDKDVAMDVECKEEVETKEEEGETATVMAEGGEASGGEGTTGVTGAESGVEQYSQYSPERSYDNDDDS
jgi:hypothetical protein